MNTRAVIRSVAALATGDRNARYRLAERTARVISADAILGEVGKLWLRDESFFSTYRRFERWSLRRAERMWQLHQYAVFTGPLGASTAECGVYRGLGSYVIAVTSDRAHHGFDSFEGVSEPQEVDGSYWSRGDLSAPEEVARGMLASLPNVTLHKGWIPERFVDVTDETFSLLHVDVDLAQPTRDALEFFGERLVPGAVVVLDDHGFDSCPGARTEAIQFARARNLQIVESATGQGIIHIP